MSELRLRIDKYLTGQTNRPPKVYVRIYALGEGARRVAGSTARRELVPISDEKKHAAVLSVDPGHYYVEAVLPSGEILAEDVLVEAGSTHELVLHADNSPHEWLSWQHLAGNVPAQQVVKRRQARAAQSNLESFSVKKAGGAGSGVRRGGVAGLRRGGARGRARAEASAASLTGAVSEVKLAGPIMWLPTPNPLLAKGSVDKHSVWDLLSDLQGRAVPELMKELNGGNKPLSVSPSARDASHSVFNVSWAGKEADVKSFKNLGPALPRHFAVVPRRDSVELLSLPMPWRVAQTNREADIQIAVQEPSEPGGFCASAIARDEEFGMLLAYLSSGALPTAREMAETAKEMLYYKVTNPFAAAAGGYALVGTATQASDREWHGWVRNLMNKFPHIPDGAIQWGQLRMRMRRTKSDVDEAKEAFKLAYRRGLPFYSMGMRWLLDGLELLSRDDPEGGRMMEQVRRMAWCTNYQQPFTILKLGGTERV